VLTYVCSDRPGAGAQIAEDVIRTIAEQVRRLGKVKKLDLFLYSRGGSVDAPWPIICLLREYCDSLGVLIPFRAHSAATLVALGCDEIVMTPQAELGPIDPAQNRVTPQEGGTPVQEEIRVEDVMSYVGFIRDKAGLGDQAAIASSIGILAEKLSPWVVGSIYRTHSHIRVVARKLLASRAAPTDEQRLGLIIESLAEKTYSHGHAVGRKEAKELGLPVVAAADDPELDALLWSLLEGYEADLEMRRPVDPDAILRTEDEAETPLSLGIVESTDLTHAFRGTLRVRRVRQAPAQVAININLGISLPPSVQPDQAAQQAIQQLLQQVQQAVPVLVKDQVRQQSPILRVEARLQGGSWVDVTSEG
jgi:hypothetical protein